jgi:sortase B
MKLRILNVIQIILLVIAAVTGGYLLSIFVRDRLSVHYWKNIQMSKTQASTLESEDILPSLLSVYEKNSDLIGWLKIEGGHIDFPVMQTKNDPEFYLRHDFEKNDYSRGVPFADYRCRIVPEQGFNTIIYGHYTNSDDMFRWLLNYSGKKWYEGHKYIQFDTLYEEGTYEIVSAFYFDATNSRLLEEWNKTENDAYTVYNFISTESISDFRKFKDSLKELSIYETEKELSMDEPVITLICCAPYAYSHIKENGRFVVVAQKIN